MAGASWYAAAWTKRIPIAGAVTAGGSGPTTADVQITIATDHDDFWTSVQADGDDVRVCSDDGKTLETYQLGTWTYASRAGVIDVDNAAFEDGKMGVLYVYYGNASATDGSGSFTPSSAKTGRPAQACPAYPTIKGKPEEPGATAPRVRVFKAVEDETYVWWDVTDLLIKRCLSSAGAPYLEGVKYVKNYQVLNGGTPVGSTTDLAETRCIAHRGRAYVMALTKGGADDTDYTLELQVVTTEGRTLNLRALMLVRNVDES